MNHAQEARLQTINDNYDVERWEENGGEVTVWCTDGDQAEIHKDGTATWTVGAFAGEEM